MVCGKIGFVDTPALIQDLIDISNPEDLVTQELVSNYILDLLNSRSSMTVYNRIQELYDCIRVMTPNSPKSHWAWLKNAWMNLRLDAYPARNKLLRLKEADQLEDLGFKLMSAAEAVQNNSLTQIQRALMFRDGLMIALLIRRPFRIENFYSLTIGVNFLTSDQGTSFLFKADEMKGKRSAAVPFPDNLVTFLKRYIDYYRPLLLAGSPEVNNAKSNALWISRYGTALTQGPLRVAIYNRTEAEFDVRIPPHWFRDSAVTTMIHDSPESAKLTGLILGHTNPDVVQKHYNQAQMIYASRRHYQNIRALIAEPYEKSFKTGARYARRNLRPILFRSATRGLNRGSDRSLPPLCDHSRLDRRRDLHGRRNQRCKPFSSGISEAHC